MDEAILRAVDDSPNVSVREVAALQGNVDHITVWRVLRENQLFPYHVQRVQTLSAADWPPRVHFCEWFIQQCVNPRFSANALFTDEASFQRDQIVNFHNQHVWADENPHAIVQSHHQHRFSVNVWAGIVGDVLIEPHVLPPTLNGARYHDFIRDTLPVLLEHVVASQLERDRPFFYYKLYLRLYVGCNVSQQNRIRSVTDGLGPAD